MFNESYGVVKVWNFFKRDEIVELSTEEEYNDYLSKNQMMVEVIGLTEQLIKPVFDIDSYDNAIDIKEIKQIINDLFPNKVIAYAKRKPRMHNGKMKESYRFYVNDTKITWRNMRKYLEMKGYDKHPMIDMSIYKTDSQLHTPNTKHKYIEKKICEVPILEVVEGSLFDCCASYVEESYEDWNPFVNKLDNDRKVEPLITFKRSIEKLDDDDNESYNTKTVAFISDIINHFKKERAVDYDPWSKVNYAIIGSCRRSKIGKRGCVELIHQFSQLAPNKYEEDKVDEWIDNNYKRQMETEKPQYGYNYLINTCLKEDNPEYYDENFNKTYTKVKDWFESKVIKLNNVDKYIELNNDIDEYSEELYWIKDFKLIAHKYMDVDEAVYIELLKDKKGNITKNKVNITFPRSKWHTDSTKKKYDKVIFQPSKLSESLSKKYFNMFQGFRIQNKEVHKDYSSIDRILFHIKNVICNKDEYTYNWFLKYLSAVLKGRRTQVMIMIKGQEGCGKNIILNAIAYILIGGDYAISTSNPEKYFFGSFNNIISNKVFAVINEGGFELRKCIETIKEYITEPKLMTEKKFENAVQILNYLNIIGNTNNFNILNISPTDRRFVWLYCNNEFCGNKDYFKLLSDDLNNYKIMSSLYHYLVEEINCPDDFDFQDTRPHTSIYKKLQQINLPNPITFLCSILNDYELLVYRKYKEEYATVKCSELYDHYKCWCAKFKYETYTYQQFETKITEDNKYGITKKIDRKNFKVFKFIRIIFEDVIGKLDNLEGLETIESDDDDETRHI